MIAATVVGEDNKDTSAMVHGAGQIQAEYYFKWKVRFSFGQIKSIKYLQFGLNGKNKLRKGIILILELPATKA